MARRRLEQVRAHERMDFKRCQMKWFWKWRKGLVPKALKFAELDLGNWMHDGLAAWYVKGDRRRGRLITHVCKAAERALGAAQDAGVPDYVLDKAVELSGLAAVMADAYQRHYGRDEGVSVIAPEVPLEFTVPDFQGQPLAVHRLKPDLVYRDARGVWLMEHKTVGQIYTDHLPIDDQARPYGAMAERALRKLGLMREDEVFRGITYNFLRRALPDERPTDAAGKALNKNGSVSKRQPGKNFYRHTVKLTKVAKTITLQRIRAEVVEIATVTGLLRSGEITERVLKKTPTKGCPRFCEYFPICTMQEEGTDTTTAERTMYSRRDPYVYDEDNPTTNDHNGFEGL
jgi:hypothetical protein